MDSLSQRAKSIISSIFALVLWAYRLPFRFQKNPQFPTLHLGLKTLIFQETTKTPQIIHNNKFSPPPSLSSESRSSSLTSSMFSDSFSSWTSTCAMDDLIGTDSGVPIILNDESQDKFGFDLSSCTTQAKSGQSCTTTHRSRKIKKEYPPPIPLHWVLKKHCSSDGRVVLQRERLRRHEYFEARRENGRLVLNIVPLDDAVTCCDEEADDDSEDDDDECDRDNVGDCYNPVRRSVSFCDDQNMNGHPQMCLVAPLRPMASVV